MRNIILFVVTVTVPLFSVAAFPDSRYITDKISVPLYPGKSITKKSKAIKTLASGTIVTVLGKEKKFTKIKTRDDVTGWVESKYLTNEKPTQIEYLQLVAKYKIAQDKIQDYQTRLLDMQELRKEAKTADWLRNKLNENEKTEQALEQQIKLKDIALADMKITIANLKEQLLRAGDEYTDPAQSNTRETRSISSQTQLSSQPIYSSSTSGSFYTWLILSLAVTLIIGILMGFVLVDYKVRRRHGDAKLY